MISKDYFLILNYLCKVCYGFFRFIRFDLRSGLIFVDLIDPSKIISVLSFLKQHSKLLFLGLIDITSVDCISINKKNAKHTFRFQLTYILVSHYFKNRIVISCFVQDNEDIISVSKIFKGALWLEREIWDMFGIFFINHSDLRRILTDYGFDGFPLRKDFPITGYLEIRYDDSQKCLVYEPLELSQEIRVFDSLSPWIF